MQHRRKLTFIAASTCFVFAITSIYVVSVATSRFQALQTVLQHGGAFSVGENVDNIREFSGELDYWKAWDDVALIDVANTDVSNEDVQLIFSAINEVQILSIGNTAVDDSVVPQLLGLANPVEIRVEGSMITHSGVVSLRTRFPQARVFEFHEVPTLNDVGEL